MLGSTVPQGTTSHVNSRAIGRHICFAQTPIRQATISSTRNHASRISLGGQLRPGGDLLRLRPQPSHVRQRADRGAVRTCAVLGGISKLFTGDVAEKTRKTYQAQVDQINALEPGLLALTDDQLRAKTQIFKDRYQRGESLNDLLVEAFAVRPYYELS
jgi:hypothetical protein